MFASFGLCWSSYTSLAEQQHPIQHSVERRTHFCAPTVANIGRAVWGCGDKEYKNLQLPIMEGLF